ncbi:aryl-alcohol oxidase [Coprinopsis sp. MPI-PUGE-AT-0042]|nr:aryl-alcohol oxidase [Coprinopsis sp. MPI-PUGE-AT-0042]
MLTSNGLRVILSSLLLTQALGALLTDSSQLRSDRTYDYVIVGAGTAGNVLADRLSAGGRSVLVLEAGVSDEGVLAAQVPFLGPTLTPGTPFDWNFTVTAQQGLDGRSFPFPRGKMLGGCSSVNYMVHHFGSSEDYNKLARDTGDNTLSWNNMKKYIFKHEKIVAPADNHNTAGQFLPNLHGTSGTVPVSLPGFSQSIDGLVIETTKQLSAEFPFNPDQGHGNGQVLGMGWTQNSIGGGVRSSSATTYLKTALSRRQVDVLVNAHVTKLVQTSTNVLTKKPVFREVQFQKGPGAPVVTVKANREIILSAGSIGSPQVLFHSGIGPKSDIEAVGIKSIVDLPSVGRNLSDHVLLPNVFNVKGGSDTLDGILRGDASVPGHLDSWTNSRQGPLANGDTPILRRSTPSTGPTASHWEMIVINFYLNPFGAPIPPAGNFMTLISALISPTSRTTSRPSSTLSPLREAVRACKRFVGAGAWKNFVLGPWGGLSATSDKDIDAYVRKQSTTVYHPYGVVDPDFRVKGIEGVRIVDAGVWPFLPNAHTQRAADVIG